MTELFSKPLSAVCRVRYPALFCSKGETMFKGLAGKSAIVTGGATLIGAAVVKALQSEGVKVTVADIDR